jgi:uncharacterized protein (TIGR02444 family)
MCADLWSFALSTYARPGVEAACLRLQAQGADVCLLLCGVWLEQRGVARLPERAAALQQLARPWRTRVVEPLREVRVQWRALAQQDAQLAELRDQVKALELEAERALLMRLEALAKTWSTNEGKGQYEWLEDLASDAADLDHNALQQLRVEVTRT